MVEQLTFICYSIPSSNFICDKISHYKLSIIKIVVLWLNSNFLIGLLYILSKGCMYLHRANSYELQRNLNRDWVLMPSIFTGISSCPRKWHLDPSLHLSTSSCISSNVGYLVEDCRIPRGLMVFEFILQYVLFPTPSLSITKHVSLLLLLWVLFVFIQVSLEQ